MTVAELEQGTTLQEILARKDCVSLSSTEAVDRFGAVLAHAETGGIVAIRDARSGRVRAFVVGAGPDTSWADRP